ncbi:Uncharacterised protein [Escherichia coli]|nr:Uncharacterised protein [Escherichia coli]
MSKTDTDITIDNSLPGMVMLPASRGASVLWFTLAEKLSTPFLIPVPF